MLKKISNILIRYVFNGKHLPVVNIMFKNIMELRKYISDNGKLFGFYIPEIAISRNDGINVRDKIASIDSEKRRMLEINKSTWWYQQKKIKEGKPIKVYDKAIVKVKK